VDFACLWQAGQNQGGEDFISTSDNCRNNKLLVRIGSFWTTMTLARKTLFRPDMYMISLVFFWWFIYKAQNECSYIIVYQ